MKDRNQTTIPRILENGNQDKTKITNQKGIFENSKRKKKTEEDMVESNLGKYYLLNLS